MHTHIVLRCVTDPLENVSVLRCATRGRRIKKDCLFQWMQRPDGRQKGPDKACKGMCQLATLLQETRQARSMVTRSI